MGFKWEKENTFESNEMHYSVCSQMHHTRNTYFPVNFVRKISQYAAIFSCLQTCVCSFLFSEMLIKLANHFENYEITTVN